MTRGGRCRLPLRSPFFHSCTEDLGQRRHAELAAKGDRATLDEVLADQLKRDEDDAGRAVAPLRPAADAVLVDTSGLDLDAVVDLLAREVDARLSARSRPD